MKHSKRTISILFVTTTATALILFLSYFLAAHTGSSQPATQAASAATTAAKAATTPTNAAGTLANSPGRPAAAIPNEYGGISSTDTTGTSTQPAKSNVFQLILWLAVLIQVVALVFFWVFRERPLVPVIQPKPVRRGWKQTSTPSFDNNPDDHWDLDALVAALKKDEGS